MNYVGIDHHRQYSHLRVYAFLAQPREKVREEVARESNIFSEKGQKVLLGLDLARGEKRLAAEIADIARFTDAANLHAYAGVIPCLSEITRPP